MGAITTRVSAGFLLLSYLWANGGPVRSISERVSGEPVRLSGVPDTLGGTALTLQENPNPLAFDPTSIKAIPSADPGSRIPDLIGPEPSSQGSARFRIPLSVPPGRQGMEPILALCYDSDGSAGIAGRGFDIPVSTVGIDTRFHLPDYDGNDHYTLDGQDLVQVGEFGGGTSYRLRQESIWNRIVRYGSDPTHFFWEVTDTGGGRSIYGGRSDAVTSGFQSNAFRWYLSRRIDVNGNSIDYRYLTDELQTYLSSIRYTGTEAGDEGPFRISFSYETGRPDRRSDSRGRFVSRIALRLKQIDVDFGDRHVCSYHFTYTTNIFSQSLLSELTETGSRGAKFWSYRFEYFEADKAADGGYAGFGPPTQMQSPATELTDTSTVGGSGSLFAGVGFAGLATVGLTTSFERTDSFDSATLVDLSGDGLADLVARQQPDGPLIYWKNIGGSFASSPTSTDLSPSLLNSSIQNAFSFGVSAGALGMAGGSVGKRLAVTTGHSGFVDINGDGLVDFVDSARSNGYSQNRGDGHFLFQPWSSGGGTATLAVLDAADVAELKSAYHLLDAVRQWKAFRSGTIVVENSISAPSATDSASDGVLVSMMKENLPMWNEDASDHARLLLPGQSIRDVSSTDIERGQSLYFRAGSVDDPEGDAVCWRTAIGYSAVKLFEDLADFCVAWLPERATAEQWAQLRVIVWDEQLWNTVQSYYVTADGSSYLRRALDDGDWAGVRRGLVECGLVIPRRLTAEEFNRTLSRFWQSARFAELPIQEKLWWTEVYAHEPGTDFFRLRKALSHDEQWKIFEILTPELPRLTYRFYDFCGSSYAVGEFDAGATVGTASSAGGHTLTFSAANDVSTDAIHGDDEVVAQGERTANRVLIERRLTTDGNQEETWVELDEQGAPTSVLISSADSQSIVPVDRADMQVWLEPNAAGGINLEYRANTAGRTVSHSLESRPGTFPVRMPTPLYLQLMEDQLPGSFDSDELQNVLLSGLSAVAADTLRSAYADREGDYHLLTDLSDAQRTVVLQILNSPISASYDREQFDSFLVSLSAESDSDLLSECYSLSSDGTEYLLASGLSDSVLLSLCELLGFTMPDSCSVGEFEATLLGAITDPEERSTVEAAYRFDGICHLVDGLSRQQTLDVLSALHQANVLFSPYSGIDDSVELRPDAAAEQVESFFSLHSLLLFSSETSSISYSEAADFPVLRAPESVGVAELSVGHPSLERPSEAAGSSFAVVPLFAENGTLRDERVYIHLFDSTSDFSLSELTVSPASEIVLVNSDGARLLPEVPKAQFAGGLYGWYYGEWNGNLPWDTSQLGLPPNKEDCSSYSGPMFAVPLGAENHWGTDAWQGTLTVSAERRVGSDGAIDDITTYSAPYITQQLLVPSRKGGSSTANAKEKTELSLDRVELLQVARERGSNNSWQLGAIGVNRSECESAAIADIIDMDGDGMPDRLFAGPDGAVQISRNSGTGFSALVESTGFPGDIREVASVATGLGFSASPAESEPEISFSPDGSLRSAEVRHSNAAIGGGANGCIGESRITADLFDINGDGLPDLVSTGASGFTVALNTGSAATQSVTFAVPQDPSPSLKFEHTTSAGVNVNLALGGVGAGFGVNVSAGLTGNRTVVDLIDMNGDGLPDRVSKRPSDSCFTVQFNTGDAFGEPVRWHTSPWVLSSGEALPVDTSGVLHAGEAIWRLLSQNGGYCTTVTPTIEYSSVQSLFSEAGMGIELNPFGPGDSIAYSGGYSVAGGATLNLTLPLFWFILLVLSPGFDFTLSRAGVQMIIRDIDGDGLPDHLYQEGGRVFYKPNQMKKVGLLNRIETPRGGELRLDYRASNRSADMPLSRWLFAEVQKSDGDPFGTGVQIYTTEYNYQGARYDRAERQFLGYAEVTAHFVDATAIKWCFANDSSSVRGLLLQEDRSDSDGTVLSSRRFQYLLPVLFEGLNARDRVVFQKPYRTSIASYDPETRNRIVTAISYQYDTAGNVSEEIDEGDTDVSGDELLTSITYLTDSVRHIVDRPVTLVVRAFDAQLLRARSARYDSRGNLVEFVARNDASDSTTLLEYDSYGNVVRVRDPNGYEVSYEYDSGLHAHRVLTSDSFGYQSSAVYDCTVGLPLAETDVRGCTVRHVYDEFARPASVWTDYDELQSGEPAVQFAYYLNEYPQRAVTTNKVMVDPGDHTVIRTVVRTDGLGRVIETGKDGERFDPDSGRTTEGMNLSGRLIYDSMGRIAQEGQPRFESPDQQVEEGAADLVCPTLTQYDDLGRVVERVLPDGSRTHYSYRIENGCFVCRVLDAEGACREEVHDPRGNVVRVRQFIDEQPIDTRYKYAAIGELLSVVDAAGNQVSCSYDLLGRRISVSTPDGGRTEYRYDAAGNLVGKVDENLRGRSQEISYHYNYNRLQRIVYPERAPTTYSYGDNPGPNMGRLVEVSNGDATTRYSYGKLGELTEETMQIHRQSVAAEDAICTFNYCWNYLGQIQSITYPDGELLTYRYDTGCRIRTISLASSAQETTYVSHIGYDESGARNSVSYGNGVTTQISYEPKRHRLETIKTIGPGGIILQNRAYRFDRTDNVVRIEENAYAKRIVQTFEYDSLHRLTGASGTWAGTTGGAYEPTATYRQSFEYDAIGRLTRKASESLKLPENVRPVALNYDNTYSYHSERAHQATQIGTRVYRYDANGNVLDISDTDGEGATARSELPRSKPLPDLPDNILYAPEAFGRARSADSSSGESSTAGTLPGITSLGWDEENCLVQSFSAGRLTQYRYDDKGCRISKTNTTSETVYAGALWQEVRSATGDIRIRYIYLGKTRVASTIGHQESISLDADYRRENTYYYHLDHLGSTSVVTSSAGTEYACYEYTPSGELFWERSTDQLSKITYLFGSNERDADTGLYYFGARYLNPTTGLWLSTDPAFNDYLPAAPTKRVETSSSASLPGLGGIFNPVNLVVYHYAGNNALRLADSGGRMQILAEDIYGKPIGFHTQNAAKLITRVVLIREAASFDPVNPRYFRDTLEVKIGTRTVYRQMVQGVPTRDDPLDSHDGPLSAGIYNLMMLPVGHAEKYARALSISGNGVDADWGYLIHPNEITELESTLFATRFDPPDSTGCIVTNGTANFDDLYDMLGAVGFGDWEYTKLIVVDQ